MSIVFICTIKFNMVVIVLGLYFWAISPYSNLYPPPHNNVVIVLDLLLRILSLSNMHDSKLGFVFKRTKIKQIAWLNTRQKCMKNDNTLHTSTPRVSSTWFPKQNGHGMHARYLGKTKIKQKYHSPSMTLSWLPIQKWSCPSKTC